jgi:hypothetical protein
VKPEASSGFLSLLVETVRPSRYDYGQRCELATAAAQDAS